MLTRLYADNYRCLVNFEVRFDEVTLLVGANGSGKSSVLDVVLALRQLLSGEAKVTDAVVFPSRTVTRWQHQLLQVFEIDVGLLGDHFCYRLEVEHERGTGKAGIKLERLTCGGKTLFEFTLGEVQLYLDDHSKGSVFSADCSTSALGRVPPRHDNKKLSRFLDHFRLIQVCNLYPPAFAAESRTEDPKLSRDGSNFSAWYRHVLQERGDLVHDYHQALAEVIDGFSSIRLEKVGTEARSFVGIFESNGTRYELKLDELSDGQRALVALYALIHVTADQGYTLFLDEPDNYVALAEIQPWLMALSDVCGEHVPQAVLCSHHPELIDYLGPEHGILLEREATGVVTTRRLDTVAGINGLRLSEVIARGWER